MTYNPNIPQATDDLSDSQVDLLNNFQSLDATFLQNHYTFSDLTANRGKHNNVETPIIVGSAHPTTPAAQVDLYAMQDTASLGLLQYSRGPSNAIPTPVTYIQSPSTPIVIINGSSSNILDFTGITTDCLCHIIAGNAGVPAVICGFDIIWTGTTFTFAPTVPLIGLFPVGVGNILTIKNVTGSTLNNVYWTLILYRVQV